MAFYSGASGVRSTQWQLKKSCEELEEGLKHVNEEETRDVETTLTDRAAIVPWTGTVITHLGLGIGSSTVAVPPPPMEDRGVSVRHPTSSGRVTEVPPLLGKCGLRNIGNTCYHNSILQVMCQTKELFSALVQNYYVSESTYKQALRNDFDLEKPLFYKRGREVVEGRKITFELYDVEMTKTQKKCLFRLISNCHKILVENKKHKLRLEKDDEPEITEEEAMNSVLFSTTALMSNFLRTVWTRNLVLTPRFMKKKLGMLSDEFADFGQKDSQEALQKYFESIHKETARPGKLHIKYSKEIESMMDVIDNAQEEISKLEDRKKEFEEEEDKKRIKEEIESQEEILRTIHGEQSDTYETARSLTYIRKFFGNSYSEVSQYSCGFYHDKRTCMVCGLKSLSTVEFNMLTVPIPSKTGMISLKDCLDEFSKEEELDGDNKVWCDHCRIKTKHKKKMTIFTLPKVLYIHLNRFKRDMYGNARKNDSYVDFPISGLKLSEYMSEFCSKEEKKDKEYELFSTSNHSGSYGGGHYTAYAKHPWKIDGRDHWYSFNDSHVSYCVTESEDDVRGVVNTSRPYILAYRQTPKVEDDEEE